MKTDLNKLTVSELRDYLELALNTHEFLLRQMKMNGIDIVKEKKLPPLYDKVNKVIFVLRAEIEQRLLSLISE